MNSSVADIARAKDILRVMSMERMKVSKVPVNLQVMAFVRERLRIFLLMVTSFSFVPTFWKQASREFYAINLRFRGSQANSLIVLP